MSWRFGDCVAIDDRPNGAWRIECTCGIAATSLIARSHAWLAWAREHNTAEDP